jgi:hypothetical protein
MGRYARFQVKSKKKEGVHPVWRGIGCLLIVIVLFISYGLTVILVPLILKTGYVTPQLAARIDLPDWLFKSPFTFSIASYLSSLNHPWISIITFLVVIIILSGITSLIYSTVYSAIGPDRYTYQDAPPPKVKVKKYTR